MKKALSLLLMTLVLSSCAANTYVVHPNSINTYDSVTADTLTIIKTTIDNARPKLANGTLPASLKVPMNDLVKGYNTADDAYKAWRAAYKASPSTSQSALTVLQQAMAAVTAALNSWTQQGGQ